MAGEPNGREMDAIYASVTLDTNGLPADAANVSKALDGVEVSAKKVDGVFTDANGRLRDARGRFVEVGSAAWNAAKGIDAGTASVVQNTVAMAKMDGVTSRTRSGLAGFGQSMLQVGRITQDFTQGGVAGVLNNIEGMAQALGGGPGLAGSLTVLGTAAFIAKPLLMKLFAADSVNPLDSAIEGLKKKIKDLDGSNVRIAVDGLQLQAATADLEAMKKALEEYNRVRGLKSEAEQKSETAVNKAIAEDPEGANSAAEAIKRNAANFMVENSSAIREARKRVKQLESEIAKEMGPGGGGDMTQVRIMEEGIRLAKEAAEAAEFAIRKKDGQAEIAAGKVLGEAEPGEDVTAHQERMASKLEEAGKSDLAAKIRDKSPAAMKAAEQFWKEMGEEIEAAGKAEDEADRLGDQSFKATVDQWQKSNEGKTPRQVALAKEEKEKADAAEKQLREDIRQYATPKHIAAIRRAMRPGDGAGDDENLTQQARQRLVDVPEERREAVARGMVARARKVVQAEQARGGGLPAVRAIAKKSKRQVELEAMKSRREKVAAFRKKLPDAGGDANAVASVGGDGGQGKGMLDALRDLGGKFDTAVRSLDEIRRLGLGTLAD